MITELTPTAILARLRARGLKATPQRIALYQVLLGLESHPTAEELFATLRPRFPALSLNTVYTSLEAMAENRLIRKIQTTQCVYRYDAKTHAHAHLVCTVCDCVTDVEGELGERLVLLAQQAVEARSFTLSDQDFYVYGQCPTCQSPQERK